MGRQSRSHARPVRLGTHHSAAGKADQLRWSGVFLKEETRTEIIVAQSETGFAILFNFHRETKTAKADRKRRRSIR